MWSSRCIKALFAAATTIYTLVEPAEASLGNHVLPRDEVGAWYTQLSRCPQSCDGKPSTEWVGYDSLDRLKQCDQPMLFEFSLHSSVDVDKDRYLLKACTTTSTESPSDEGNPGSDLTTRRKRQDSDACAASTNSYMLDVEAFYDANTTVDDTDFRIKESTDVLKTLFAGLADNQNETCKATVRFAYSQGIFAGAYAGVAFAKNSVVSVGNAMEKSFSKGLLSGNTIAQICSQEPDQSNTLGVAISATGDLSSVRKALAKWSQGGCVSSGSKATSLPGVSIRQRRGPATQKLSNTSQISRDTWQAKRAATFELRNATLMPLSDGTCASYITQPQDTCTSIAAKFGITMKNIRKWNDGTTWGWNGCDLLNTHTRVCVSSGKPPMPMPLKNAICGPLVPGSSLSHDNSSMADLNPCPLNACCNIWGQCGITENDYCQEKPGPFANPGSSPRDAVGCISNCGSTWHDSEPFTFSSLAYYDANSQDRDCLTLPVSQASMNNAYDVIMWAFAEVDTNTWTPVINDPHNSWDQFTALKRNRVVSFGDWGFSSNSPQYQNLKDAMGEANRDTFVKNILQFLRDQASGIDGVDFNWQHQGSDAIDFELEAGQDHAASDDASNYLAFLQALKAALDGDDLLSGKTVSIVLPASYWYLRHFPVAEMAKNVHSLIVQTYDMHGQWDAERSWTQEGCASGRCLRSHVNLTETEYALTMVERAGVPVEKIWVGEAAYGRSFKMAHAGCQGPDCEFLGSNLDSPAEQGRCTKTPGILANAEIEEIKQRSDVKSYHDAGSNTDILIYNDTQWVAYMSADTQKTRKDFYESKGFGGVVTWAVDLQTFAPPNDTTTPNPEDDPRWQDRDKCILYKPANPQASLNQCEIACAPEVESAKNAGKTINWGCNGFWPLDQPIPWFPIDGNTNGTVGKCVCDVQFVNELFEDFLQAAIAAAEIGCLITMSTFQLVVDIGSTIFPEVGGVIDVGLETLSQMAKLIDYTYGPENDPLHAFESWLSPCGNLDMVPQDIKDAFATLTSVADELVGFTKPKWPKGSGRRGDSGNPDDLPTKKPDSENNPPKETQSSPDTESGPTSTQSASETNSDSGSTSTTTSDSTSESTSSTTSDTTSSTTPTTTSSTTSSTTPSKTSSTTSSTTSDPTSTTTSDSTSDSETTTTTSSTTSESKGCTQGAFPTKTNDGNQVTVISELCKGGTTTTFHWEITSISYGPTPTAIAKTCSEAYGQMCDHYSSAIQVNPAWDHLACPTAAATPAPAQKDLSPAKAQWLREHAGEGWTDPQHRNETNCSVVDFPPDYLLDGDSQVWKQGGRSGQGQLVRYLPDSERQKASEMWTDICWSPLMTNYTAAQLWGWIHDPGRAFGLNKTVDGQDTKYYTLGLTVDHHPLFHIAQWDHVQDLPNQGLDDNPCWPKRIARKDPGFPLLRVDPWYTDHAQPSRLDYDYSQPWDPANRNGSPEDQ